MSAEEPTPPSPNDLPAAVPSEPLAPAQTAASASPPSAADQRRRQYIFIAVVAAILIAVFAAVLLRGVSFNGVAPPGTYSVQPYAPPAQIISRGDHVIAYRRPETTSPAVVMFGPGVALTVIGRVSRGLGDDWYAITWNGNAAFVRQQDATTGQAAAPPVTAPHPAQPIEVPYKPDADDEVTMPEEDTEAPPAPSNGPLDLNNVQWVHAPSARDFARYFPDRALDRHQSGRVVLDCVARNSGMLDCSVAEENPGGFGFGDAALAIAQQARIQPTMPDGRSVAGGHLRLPLAFRAD